MPVLPLDHPEPFAATLGVMLFPGEDDADRKKATAYAAHCLAEPLRQFHEEGGTLDYDSLRFIAEGGGDRLDDLDKRWLGGIAAGQVFKTYFALANTDSGLASWSNAIRIAQHVVADKCKASRGRSTFMEAKSRFLTVAHLWGAWCLREGNFSSQPNVGYDLTDDFHSFLTEAEILRHWGQSWRHGRAKADPPLPAEVWRVPEDWEPPGRRPNWPLTGMIPDLVLPDKLLEDLRPAGRPKKSG